MSDTKQVPPPKPGDYPTKQEFLAAYQAWKRRGGVAAK